MNILLFFVLSLPLLAWLASRFLAMRARRLRLEHMQAPFEPAWVDILERNVSLYRKLPAVLRPRLHGCINLFLNEKIFAGCAGLTITDEIRLTIAGNACMLVLSSRNQQGERPLFPGFKTILVYPETYVASDVSYDGLVESRSEDTRAGESWHGGPVVLSWSDVLFGSRIDNDGFNVVLHEFAHKLDEENPAWAGLPVLSDSTQYAEWSRVLCEEYEAFRGRVATEADAVIDDYGAESPGEFFAVVTETFFEKPGLLYHHLPELYAQLERLYGVNPRTWSAEASGRM